MTYSAPKVEVTSAFWKNYRDLVAKKVLPYQWQVITNQIEVDLPLDPGGNPTTGDTLSYAVENLRIAADQAEGKFHGMPFQDSDVYKWLESAAYALQDHDDADLKEIADGVVDLIAAAQQPDGYIDTFFQIKWPDRKFARIQQSHELYTMGHYIEAGVAYYEATGNEKALDIARKIAACIGEHFGDEAGKVHGADGHPEIELALARLAEVTGESKYAELGRWFLHVRGKDPEFYDKQNKADGWDRDFFEQIKYLPRTYYQAAEPVTKQQDAEGHAVRVMYLCTGMAHIARLTGDDSLLKACHTFWESVVHKRMFVTGQIGTTKEGESFTYDYDLPNDAEYGETCASVGMSFFARRMLELEPKGEYGDVLEKELFNGSIAGMALDGRHFYYVNPLEVDPRKLKGNPDFRHVLAERAGWFACACCPANLSRLIASVDRYIYAVQDDGTILADQFIANKATFQGGVVIEQRSNFPWEGHVEFTIDNPEGAEFRFGIRIPAWSKGAFTLAVNGEETSVEPEDGFVYLPIASEKTDIALDLDMTVKELRANTRVAEDAGRVAVTRGPLVYTAESADNDGDLWLYAIKPGSGTYEFKPELLGGVGTITEQGVREIQDESDDLYLPAGSQKTEAATVKFIPYYAWANRGEGQMRVWQRTI
ncbi:glycoside hydrolase family 127 protein [Bifidobacterium sp. 82T24]|uniref:Glycoside hydrolase family 127 protein n=1 Tax=Bifidobacterium saimiriisciurei TaxID=2661627 RepID=A0ABX0CGJ3_9BIFI|nr:MULTISPECIES: beta-L-arabinofuranosidase domain-containing protein [Bifidobacterium]MBW3088348.1 glycoside hydrolase family 127 protein [Bifidobacterium pluvialisilvae]NEG97023.1 glycoside hydrolase family 127 protein [Bifidobacterium sp. SMB2]NEH11994.1 glycoside hydrolase family 127 protein [Bifidobacterium saimiriisciurei]